MTVVHAQINIPRDTGLPEDVTINNLYFKSEGVLLTDVATIHSEIEDFFLNVPPGGTAAPTSYLSPVCGATCVVKYYDLDDPVPRAPLDELQITLVPGTTSIIPEEAAITLSFQGEQLSGIPQARRRGRIFFGPLDGGVSDVSMGRVRVKSVVRDDLTSAMEKLQLDCAAANVVWGVYSPTTRGASVNSEDGFVPISNGWVDDAFDTIRSRGPAALLRTEWSA